MKKYDEPTRRKIAGLYKAGVTTEALKERYGIKQSNLLAILREFNVEARHGRSTLSNGMPA